MEESIINKVLEQVNIVDVVKEYVPLTKQGRDYVGICPFHEDSNPSFHVNSEKRLCKCFSCGAGGNAISFIQKFNNCDFKTAFNKVIDLANLSKDLKMNIIKENTYDPYDESQRRQIKINEAIQEYLRYRICTNIEGCLNYADERGLNEPIREKFGIGYFDDAEVIVNFLEKKYKFSLIEIAENDLFRSNDNGIYSPYVHRITIPIYDRFNNLIGFAGRKAAVETKMEGKYINPSTTDIFQKSKVLFNHYMAKSQMKPQMPLYIVEGYVDVFAMDSNGFESVVALMGTALTKEHINILKSIKDRDIVFVLDGDKAGQHSMHKIYQQCSNEQLDVMFVVLPEDKDPDDMFKKDKDAMIDILKNYQYGYEFEIEYYGKQPKPNFKKQKEQIMNMMKDFSKQPRDELDKSRFFSLVQQNYGLEIEEIRKSYESLYQKNRMLESNVITQEKLRYEGRMLREAHDK